MRKSGLLLFVSISLSGFHAHAQNAIAEQAIRDAFNGYRTAGIHEKLYVHTDKNFYLTGEILWFRIYDMDATFQRTLDISKIAYVELLDNSNKPVLQQKVSLKPGEASGSFIIPPGILTGNYRFRAYTRWMRNFGPDYFFSKTISIVNPHKLEADSAAKKADRYDIQFFPEGGNLIQNLESKVGFRITDAYGMGMDCTGRIVDNNQDTILKFQPLVFGLGHFMFTPLTGHTYRAIVNFPNGNQVTRDLPPAYSSGYEMNISKTAEKQLTVTVSASGNPDPAMYAYLFVHTRGDLKKFVGQYLKDGKAIYLINTDDLGDGISDFTVFNFNELPVCERLYFKYPQKGFQIQLPPMDTYETRKKIQLDLSTSDHEGKPVRADMSMAVYRLDSLQTLDKTDIIEYLYLSSELGGGIESPEYYFGDSSSVREEAMDNLMLTQGWRRFKWQDLLQKKPAPIQLMPEYNGHIIQGKLVDNKTGAGTPDVNVYLSIPSTRTQFRATPSNAEGRVNFEMTGMYGSQEIIVQTNPKEDSSSHIDIESPFDHQFTSDQLTDISVPSITSPALLDESIHAQVQQIYSGNKMQQFIMPAIDTNFFYVTPDEGYLLDDYTRFLTMEEVLREYVTSVDVLRKRDKFQLLVYNYPLKEFFRSPPLILIDGVPVFDPNRLFHQDPLKVRRIDLITREYFLGYQILDGVVNCTTYHGDLDGFDMDPHATVLDYPGIPGQREFFTPVYETEQAVSSRMPDFRTLLYWSPQIKTGLDGKNQISFYTSDLPGKYAMVVQGLTEKGEPGSRVVFFTVKK